MACFGLLNISRLFKQLCQYQAHAVNHQPRKCRTPDFYNRQNGTSWESGTFPIKFFPISLYEYVLNRQLNVWEKPITDKEKNKKQKTCFPALLSEGWANHELLSLSARCFFVIRTLKSFNLFGPGFALLYAFFLSNSWDFIF